MALLNCVNDAADWIEVTPLGAILSAGDDARMSADIADVAANAENSATQTNNLFMTAPPLRETSTSEHAAFRPEDKGRSAESSYRTLTLFDRKLAYTRPFAGSKSVRKYGLGALRQGPIHIAIIRGTSETNSVHYRPKDGYSRFRDWCQFV